MAVGTGIAHGISFVELKKVQVLGGGLLAPARYIWSTVPLERKKTAKKKRKHGAAASSDSSAPPSPPKGPETIPIRSKWIYAFATGDLDNKRVAILAREIKVDDKGKLSSLDGLTRRHQEVDVAPDPAPVAGVALAHTIQGANVFYVFIATRGRLGIDAIHNIEQMLTVDQGNMAIFQPQYLQPDDSKQLKALVIDPLTLAEALALDYQKTLDHAQDYWIPNDPNKSEKENEDHKLKLAQYRLAKMIQESLVPPHDPLGVKQFLQGNGEDHPNTVLHDTISEVEIAADKRISISRQKVRTLLGFLDTPLWKNVKSWYLGGDPTSQVLKTDPKSKAATTIGQYFLDAEARTKVRWNETPEGRKRLLEDLKEARNWYFAPEDEHDPDANKKWQDWAPILRRTIMATSIFWVEFAPTLIAYRMVKNPAWVIERTFTHYFKTVMAQVTATEYGVVWRRLRLRVPVRIERVSYKKAKEELEKWIEGEKAEWPTGTRARKAAAVLANVFIGVELVNLALQLNSLIDECLHSGSELDNKKRAAIARVVAGALDLVVAAEEPIKEFSRGAAEAGEEESGEVVAELGKLNKFRLVGAAGAFVDVYVHYLESLEALEEGQTELAVAHAITGGGAGLAGIGSTVGAFAGPEAAGALVVASLSMLVLGVAIMAAGYLLIFLYKRTEWQLFAEHCIFGVDNPFCNGKATHLHDGKTSWSGGWFHKWTADEEGLKLQTEVLTAMLCSFNVGGQPAGMDGGCQIGIEFGAIPPNGRLHLDFNLTYQDRTKASPSYLIDLESRAILGTWGPATSILLTPFYSEHGLHSLRIGFDRVRVPITEASCSAVIMYGENKTPQGEPILTGTVPIEGQLVYEIIKPGSDPNSDVVSSLKVKEKTSD